jgi:hypothetical protein
MKRKLKPIRGKEDKIIAAKVSREKLEDDFNGYYDNVLKLLDAESLKIDRYDEKNVIMYNREISHSKLPD